MNPVLLRKSSLGFSTVPAKMKLAILLVAVLACLCIQNADSRRFRRPGAFTIQIRNSLTDPNFDETINVNRVPFIIALVRASKRNNAFRFSGSSPTGENGFSITAVNGVANDDNNQWVVIRANGDRPTTGADRIFPRRSETILIDFVARETETEPL